jgi:hypothetical protein
VVDIKDTPSGSHCRRSHCFRLYKALGGRFDSLIHQPLQKIEPPPHGCATLVVVVDTLDECEKERDIEVTPDLWSLQKSQAFVMAHLAKMDV